MTDIPTTTRPTPPLLLRAEEAAGVLGVSRSVFYRLHSRGLVPEPLQIGGVKRWSYLALVTWVQNGCPRPGDGATVK